jgi:hypothetical protein
MAIRRGLPMKRLSVRSNVHHLRLTIVHHSHYNSLPHSNAEYNILLLRSFRTAIPGLAGIHVAWPKLTRRKLQRACSCDTDSSFVNGTQLLSGVRPSPQSRAGGRTSRPEKLRGFGRPEGKMRGDSGEDEGFLGAARAFGAGKGVAVGLCSAVCEMM